MKKDVKKSSYYVWFLGAQECKNVRDVESVIPVISALAEREKKVTPFKFTLQVSHRGLKIVHNASVLSSLPGGKSSKSDLVKHLIPDHAVTCVHRDEDLVAVILLLYNPATKWPVHVHVYRCDSVETAAVLSGQLQTLVDRPENRKKLDDMEARFMAKSVELQPCSRTVASAAASERKTQHPRRGESSSPPPPPLPSSSSECGIPPGAGGGHMTALYDSLAAELKKKLSTGAKSSGAPILLPPRDYDTVHRHRGNLSGIDFRRCMSANIVGVNGVAKTQEFRRSGAKMQGSSGGSSGIGSDHAPSPEQYEPENTYADNNSSSDDDWNASPLEEPVFATKPAHDYPLPRIRRQDSGVDSNSSPVHASPEKEYYYGSRQEQCTNPVKRQTTTNAQQIAPNLREKYSDRNVALVQPRPRKCEVPCGKKSAAPPAVLPAEFARKPAVEVRRQRTPSPNRSVRETPRERFKDAKEKFLMLEKERMDEQRSALKKCMERQRRGNVVPAVIRSAVRGSCEWSSSRGGSDDDGGNDETNGNRYNYNDDDDDDDFDGKGLMNNAKRSNRSRESLDKDYNNSSYSKPISNRRSRNSQQQHHDDDDDDDDDEPRPAPRNGYSSDDYQLERNYRPSLPDDRHRYKSPPQRRTVAEAPRAAPRRNHYSDVQSQPPPQQSSRPKDYCKRRYAYEDVDGDGGCCPPTYGRQETPLDGRTAVAAADDDDGGGPPPTAAGRDYSNKRRSATAVAYSYDDHHHLHSQQRHHHHHQLQDLGGGGIGAYVRPRETMSDKRMADDNGAAYPTATSPVSPRYRHSYAEPYHRHQHLHQNQPPPPPQDHPLYRHNGSLQSGRIGIAAIHPY